MSKINIGFAAGTDVGLRRKNNEDNFVVCRDLESNDWLLPVSNDSIQLGRFGSLLVVADGMGGMNAGEVASEIAVETVRQMFTDNDLSKVTESEKSVVDFLSSVVKTADHNILRHAKEDSSTQGMGTTIVLTWIFDEKVYVCWCGDSRCYVFNPSIGLTQLSKDHSYVQELVDRGELDAEQAIDHPMSNIITRSLGDEEHRAEPDTIVYTLRNGDILLLCSDGLCGLCRDEEIMNVLQQHCSDLQTCKTELIKLALNAGGYDNVTVALGVFHKDAEEKNELSDTIVKKHRCFRFLPIMTFFFLLILAVVAYYFFPYKKFL